MKLSTTKRHLPVLWRPDIFGDGTTIVEFEDVKPRRVRKKKKRKSLPPTEYFIWLVILGRWVTLPAVAVGTVLWASGLLPMVGFWIFLLEGYIHLLLVWMEHNRLMGNY